MTRLSQTARRSIFANVRF